MKYSLLVLCVSLIAPAFVGRAQENNPQSALQRWGRSLRDADIEKTAAFYEPSDKVLVLLSTGRIRQGPAEIRAMYREAFEEVVFEKVGLGILSLRQSGDVAWAATRFTADTRLKSDQTTWKLEIHTTFVLQRSGDDWKIVLEHSSPLADVPRVRRR